MSKHRQAFYFPTVGYYVQTERGRVYRCGIPMYERKRDKTFYIVEDGKRINVAVVSAHGTVVKIQ